MASGSQTFFERKNVLVSNGLSIFKMSLLTDNQVRSFVGQAMAELQAKTAGLDALIHFQEVNWSLDQDTGLIEFARDNFKVTAPVQIIGTFNTTDSTWLWAWDHPSIDESLRAASLTVRRYGEEHNIPAITSRKVKCSEADCWEFTALACKLCDAQGAYRGPSGTVRVFMTFGKIKMSAR